MTITDLAPVERSSRLRDSRSGLTIIVPAFNEAETIADTIRSLHNQTVPPEEIIVVDDCSRDETGEIAQELDATVVRPPSNTGSKAGAQTFALPGVRTEFTVTIDADTVLAPDALRLIFRHPRPDETRALEMRKAR